MSEKEIREYAKMMEELGLTGLEVDLNTGRFRLERNKSQVMNEASQAGNPPINSQLLNGMPQAVTPSGTVAQAVTSSGAVPQGVTSPEAAQQVATSSVAAAPAKAFFEVKSPIVGIFYQAPMENAAPYVKVGDHVNKGDVLCIVEAMKLMNEITAEKSGTIAEVCIKDGQAVDYDCTLFRLEEDV